MNHNIIGRQIMLLRKKFGLTQEDLALKLGYSKQTISNWETGLKTPRMGAIQKISDLFNVSKSFIIDGDHPSTTLTQITDTSSKLDEKRQKIVLSTAEKQLEEQLHGQQHKKLISLEDKRKEKERFSQDRKGEKRGVVSAGLGISNFYEDIVDEDSHEWPTIPIPDDAPCDFDWVYTASGDSMEPLFQDEDIVYVKALDEYERSNLDTNNIYAVRVDGISYLKKIRITEHGMYLVSLNKKYEDILVSEESNIKVVGKVVLEKK